MEHGNFKRPIGNVPMCRQCHEKFIFNQWNKHLDVSCSPNFPRASITRWSTPIKDWTISLFTLVIIDGKQCNTVWLWPCAKNTKTKAYTSYSRLYLTNKLHFPVRAYCTRSQRTSQRVKNKKYDTSNVIYLFYTIKMLMVYWRIWGVWKKKNKSANMNLTPSVCVL